VDGFDALGILAKGGGGMAFRFFWDLLMDIDKMNDCQGIHLCELSQAYLTNP
jgi:hypothetical protein